jgi:hypothetical protein
VGLFVAVPSSTNVSPTGQARRFFASWAARLLLLRFPFSRALLLNCSGLAA